MNITKILNETASKHIKVFIKNTKNNTNYYVELLLRSMAIENH